MMDAIEDFNEQAAESALLKRTSISHASAPRVNYAGQNGAVIAWPAGMLMRDKLKMVRTRAGMNQPELARKIGVSAVSVSKWELGKTSPSAKHLKSYLSIFECPEEWLMGNDEKQKIAEQEKPNENSVRISMSGVFNGQEIGQLLMGLATEKKFECEIRVESL